MDADQNMEKPAEDPTLMDELIEKAAFRGEYSLFPCVYVHNDCTCDVV